MVINSFFRGSSFMFITPAYAQAAGGPGGSDLFGMLFPLILIMAVFWFLLIRPQQKKMKQHQEMIANLRRGDTVVTSGGMIGKISKVIDEHEIMVEVAENMKLRFQASAVAEVRVKGEPAKTPAKTATKSGAKAQAKAQAKAK